MRVTASLFCIDLGMLGGLNVTVRQTSNSNYATDKSKLFSRDPVQSRFTFSIDHLLAAGLVYRSKFRERKMHFFFLQNA